jgi:hypothetical protein
VLESARVVTGLHRVNPWRLAGRVRCTKLHELSPAPPSPAASPLAGDAKGVLHHGAAEHDHLAHAREAGEQLERRLSEREGEQVGRLFAREAGLDALQPGRGEARASARCGCRAGCDLPGPRRIAVSVVPGSEAGARSYG